MTSTGPVIKVPTVPGPPGVCWAKSPDYPWGYCQLKAGHDSGTTPTRHQWEKETP